MTRTRIWRVFIFSYSRLVLIYLYMQLMWLFLGRIAPTNFDLPHSTTIYTFISFLYTLVLSSEFLLFLPMILFISMLEKKMIARMGNGCGSCVEGKMAQDQLFMWIVDACLALYADVIFRLYYMIHFYNLGDYVIVMLPLPSHWGPDFVLLRVGLNIRGLKCLWNFFVLTLGH